MAWRQQESEPKSVRAAQIIVGVQALALLAGAVALLVATLVATSHRLWIPLAEAGLAVAAAVILAGCARGLGHGRRSARTPVILTQLLCLPVGYSLGIQAGRIAIGGPILLAAVAVLVLLFTPSALAGLD